ncbi:hypothetical protein [Methylobacterium sp. 1030]|uniref:hypothetical protein n=1 Tax=Methylobacterium sp. 1030 TaxID=3156404 RepID=UPI0033942BEA
MIWPKALLTLWNYRAHIALIALLIGAFLYVQHREAQAYARGVKDTEANYANAEKEARNAQARKLHEIRQLDDNALVRRYCASSVFDVPTDECVRRYPLFRR